MNLITIEYEHVSTLQSVLFLRCVKEGISCECNEYTKWFFTQFADRVWFVICVPLLPFASGLAVTEVPAVLPYMNPFFFKAAVTDLTIV